MSRDQAKDMEVLLQTVAYLIDAVSWHLHGAAGADDRSLRAARRTFERHFVGQVREDDAGDLARTCETSDDVEAAMQAEAGPPVE